jgi:anti-sigma B factor antagonist
VTMLPLTVTITRRGRVCVLGVSGELDIATAPTLTQQAAIALRPPTERLIIDLSGLRFVDCCGARALAAVASAAPPGCPVLVRGASPRVRRILDLLGVPLERHGTEALERAEWLTLESQVVRSQSWETRADSEALVAQSRQARWHRAVRRGCMRRMGGAREPGAGPRA